MMITVIVMAMMLMKIIKKMRWYFDDHDNSGNCSNDYENNNDKDDNDNDNSCNDDHQILNAQFPLHVYMDSF